MKRKIIYVLLLIALIFISVNIWCSYNLLQVNTFTYQTEKVSEELHTVVIGDLHDHSFGAKQNKLVENIKKLKPDVIFMVGDFVNKDSKNANNTYQLVEQLAVISPVYFALGNHEIDFMKQQGNKEFVKKLTKLGAVVLEKDYVDITLKGNSLRIGGMYDYAFGHDDYNTVESASPEIKNFLNDFQNTDACKIMLSHRPDSFIFGDASSYWDIDLVINGHNHGGQVVIPFLGGLYGGDQGFFPTYVHGLYKKDKMHIFITSGLGAYKETLPRFNNIPEIAQLIITPK